MILRLDSSSRTRPEQDPAWDAWCRGVVNENEDASQLHYRIRTDWFDCPSMPEESSTPDYIATRLRPWGGRCHERLSGINSLSVYAAKSISNHSTRELIETLGPVHCRSWSSRRDSAATSKSVLLVRVSQSVSLVWSEGLT